MRKTRLLPFLLTIASAGILLAGCGSNTSDPATTSADPNTGASAMGTQDLTAGIAAAKVQTEPVTSDFTVATANFSVDFFKQVATGQENYLVSPLSVELALAMTANGASGQTLSQMEDVLGGGMPITSLDAILPNFVKSLPNTDKSKFNLANSLWYNNSKNVHIEKSFLQTNADYYGAEIYSAPFNGQTLKSINAWGEKKTDGMVPDILQELDPSSASVLLNALVFDGQWDTPYNQNQVHSGTFTSASGQKQSVPYLSSNEGVYLDDGMATGFAKPYGDNAYRFVALMPNEGVSMAAYLKSLTGGKLVNTLAHPQNTSVITSLPEFSFSYKSDLNDALQALGMKDAFSPNDADFSRMGTAYGAPLFIGKVVQNTFISVTPLGTKAGAVSAVEMRAGASRMQKFLTLNRPFVFGIVDTKTNLPLFLGVLNSVNS